MPDQSDAPQSLAASAEQLPPAIRELHRAVLRGFRDSGRSIATICARPLPLGSTWTMPCDDLGAPTACTRHPPDTSSSPTLSHADPPATPSTSAATLRSQQCARSTRWASR
jgi:hypothetical protein